MTNREKNTIVINSSNKIRDTWTDLEFSPEKDQMYISTQENRQLAPRQYKKISKSLAAHFTSLANKEGIDRAVAAMNHYLFAEVQEEDKESYIKFWSQYFPKMAEKKED